MNDDLKTHLGAGEIAILARAAALDLAADRAEVVGAALADVLALLERLDEVDLGELPPSNAFDPRWRTPS